MAKSKLCKCGHFGEPILIKKHSTNPNAQHIKMVCRECGAFIKWASKDEYDIWDVNNKNKLF